MGDYFYSLEMQCHQYFRWLYPTISDDDYQEFAEVFYYLLANENNQ